MSSNMTSTHHDPAKKNDGKKLSGELICKYCHALYQEKRWQSFENLDTKFIDQLHKTVCPACHMEKNHISDGVLHLTGVGVIKNLAEIKKRIENVAAMEEKRDILNRIERIEETKNGLTIYTAKNQLAVELGKKISEDHKGGALDIKWSKGDKVAEVTWKKD